MEERRTARRNQVGVWRWIPLSRLCILCTSCCVFRWVDLWEWSQVVFAIAGTLLAAVLVATLGDTSAHKALLAARHSQEQQMAGSWAADHKGMMRLAALRQLAAKKASLATKAPGDQSSDDDESGEGDVKETVANKLFGAEAGSGGNTAEPPYEVDEDSDVGLFPSNLMHALVRLLIDKEPLLLTGGTPRERSWVQRLRTYGWQLPEGLPLSADHANPMRQRPCSNLLTVSAGDYPAGIAVSNFPGDYIAGTDSNDYTDDLERRMKIHRCLEQGWVAVFGIASRVSTHAPCATT